MLNGNGISRDIELAKKRLTLAVQQGNEWAQEEGLDELNAK
jgi:TPR repeat protein